MSGNGVGPSLTGLPVHSLMGGGRKRASLASSDRLTPKLTFAASVPAIGGMVGLQPGREPPRKPQRIAKTGDPTTFPSHEREVLAHGVCVHDR